MPLYDFQCKNGHVTEKFYRMKDARPRSVRCGSCQSRASRIYSRAAVQDDFPEHYNWSIGEVVRNRAHLKQIQRDRGLQDWQPVKESPQLSNLRKQGYL